MTKDKVFGSGRAVPLDRNAKVRVLAFAEAWTALHCQGGQHRGPLTRAFLEVLETLLWGFHNSRTGVCFPSYERIAEKAGCARSTVAEALKALEFAGVLTWQNRITRIRERCQDLFGRNGWRWRVIRTSNAYVFRDPKAPDPSKSENPTGTLDQETSTLPFSIPAAVTAGQEALRTALERLGASVAAREELAVK